MSFYGRTEEENYEVAKELVIKQQLASVATIQRYLRIGYQQAVRIIERLEQEGVVGPFAGGKPREVFIKETQE
ncbi:DNA translocase FtsK [Cytobacillus kochii]|uniref:DNA translocase FtsK n=1 Tax=Cytobacillus kochii TaxID=859143 RepID=UPI003F810B1D